MSDLLERVALAAENISNRHNAAAHRLARSVETIQREAFRLADLGIPADVVALIAVAIESVTCTPAYRDSRAALDRALSAAYDRAQEARRTDQMLRDAGREAISAKRRKAQRIDLSNPRNVEYLTELDRNSPEGLDLPDGSTFYSEDDDI